MFYNCHEKSEDINFVTSEPRKYPRPCLYYKHNEMAAKYGGGEGVKGYVFLRDQPYFFTLCLNTTFFHTLSKANNFVHSS